MFDSAKKLRCQVPGHRPEDCEFAQQHHHHHYHQRHHHHHHIIIITISILAVQFRFGFVRGWVDGPSGPHPLFATPALLLLHLHVLSPPPLHRSSAERASTAGRAFSVTLLERKAGDPFSRFMPDAPLGILRALDSHTKTRFVLRSTLLALPQLLSSLLTGLINPLTEFLRFIETFLRCTFVKVYLVFFLALGRAVLNEGLQRNFSAESSLLKVYLSSGEHDDVPCCLKVHLKKV